jgi:polyferredoxin
MQKSIEKASFAFLFNLPKPIVFIILIFGFLFLVIAFFISIFTFGYVKMGWLYGLGILLIVSSLFLGLMPGGILRKEEVIDNWSILIEKGNGKSEEIFKDAENFLKESKAPNIETNRKKYLLE